MRLVHSTFVVATLLVTANQLVAQDTNGVPPEVVEDWSYFIGDWQVEGQIGRTRVTGTASFKWSNGKQSYYGEQSWKIGSNENVIHLSLLGGWDSSTNETIEQGFDSSGGLATTRYEIQSGSELPVTKSGTIDGHSRRGGAWSGKTSIKRISADKYELTTTVDGERLHTLTFRKQSADVE